MSYYQTLGIKEDATESDIKKAYRKLSRQFHPDKAPFDKQKEYTEKFAKINQANEVLSDQAKRQLYDMGGEEAVKNMGEGMGGPDLSGLFGGVFGPGVRFHMGGRGFGQQKRKLDDIVIRIKISLEEVFTGTKKNVTYKKQVNSDEEEEKLEIEVPPGCGDNVVMVKRSAGHEKDGCLPGDVKIAISHLPHKLFKMNDNDLILEKDIKFGTSLLGTSFTVKHVNGESLTIKTNGPISNGSIQIIPDKGVPHMRNENVLGNLIIKYNVDMDVKLSDKERKLIKTIFDHDKFSVDKNAKVLKSMSAEEYKQSIQQEEEGHVQECTHQ